MAINFPDSPTLNQEFTSAGRTWKWDGTTWVSVGSLTVADITDLTATATEINYTDGVTSAIQTQLNSKASFPSQTGNAGQLLVTDGTNASWSNTITANSSTSNALIARATTGQTGKILSVRDESTNNVFFVDSNGPNSRSFMSIGYENLTSGNRDLIFYADGSNSTVPSAIIRAASGTGNISIDKPLTATPAPGTTTTAATGVGYMGIPPTSQASNVSITLTAADAGETIYSTGTRTVTIPAGLPVGTTFVFIAAGGTVTTIAISTESLLMAGTGTGGAGQSRTLAAHGMATAVKVNSTTWYISGNGLS